MKIPKRIQPLIDDGIVDAVISRLMSGKEADVFVVRCGSEVRCAKVYKEARKRSFKQAVHYTEGRKVRNSRRERAMKKGSKYGRQETEAVWQTTEVDALYKLADADVRVPTPHGCVDGVLLMELICDANGDVAPRLADVTMTAEKAIRDHAQMMVYVARMLCAGLVHGDLSEFNVLVNDDGPVIIDLPQVVQAAGNNHAESMLYRDVDNLTNYYGQFAPVLLEGKFSKELWALFEAGELHANTVLTGHFEEDLKSADVDAVMTEINAAIEEEEARLERIQSAE
ncbi:MAG: serine protein kinase RIO [Gammaproteobacteria bacterium]|uniref:non-specific serine/threonine protein kinase n=1 Tax=OM182 bacterium MED-G24 TaxID=1986255 RepID=A0A2A5WPI5_9GAMM|nr:serine protein kinase RIO [Gammaproteobacteria bacterium]PDH38178.1 MAG: serine protein kinase RIO [OM182 bacterium MED-G24]RPG25843.1 MAG: serine protein kinase RIO [Gammaproteobacteria bacterium TMED50]|tara:strand:+ start:57 stop:905 length:849 start_codon:yes stop_codon:yes gene_type:complete